MIEHKTIIDIRKNAIDSMKKDSDGELILNEWKKFVFIFSFYTVPAIISIVSWFKDIKLTLLENYIGSGIAIFTGLFFSLLLSIGSKVREEKNNPDKDVYNFQQFKNNMKQIADITLYIISLGIFIFLLLFLNTLFNSIDYIIIEKIFTVVTLFFLTRYMASLFFMIQRFFFVIRDEINNIL